MSKQQLAQTWSQIAADFDQIGPPFFAQSGHRLVTLAQISKGNDILDAAAGRGAILFPAAVQVGENGRVVSIDLAAGMVNKLTVGIRDAGMRQTAVCQMDGEQLAFANASFDAVLCGHAIFYFPHATREFYRVLRLGGRVGLSIIAQGTFDWLWQLFNDHITSEEPPVDKETDEPAINSPNGLQYVLKQAGFNHIKIREEVTDLVYTDEETWWANLWALGTRTTLEKMSPAALQSFKSDLFQALRAFKQPDGFHILIHTLFAFGEKPQ